MPKPHLVSVEEMAGNDAEETRLLRDMADKAQAYVRSFSWSSEIDAVYLGYGVGQVIALFLVVFTRQVGGTDDRLWVVVGDLPSAYFVMDEANSIRTAIECYCALMDDWITAVMTFGDFGAVFPVRAEPTAANAEELRRRLDLIRREVIPGLPTDRINL